MATSAMTRRVWFTLGQYKVIIEWRRPKGLPYVSLNNGLIMNSFSHIDVDGAREKLDAGQAIFVDIRDGGYEAWANQD